VEIALPEDAALHVPAARAALDEADRVEALLSVFRASSELTRINHEGVGGAADVDAEVLALLERCRVLHAETDGAFDITSSPLSRCWGFHQGQARVPSDAEIADACSLVGMPRVVIDEARRHVRFAVAGMSINFNAIGKGYALDRMADVMRHFGVRQTLL